MLKDEKRRKKYEVLYLSFKNVFIVFLFFLRGGEKKEKREKD